MQITMRSRSYVSSFAAISVCLALSVAEAGPWAQVGDAQLRSDIELLAGAGVTDNVTMQWPLPWAALLDRVDPPGALNGQPDYVREAADRVRVLGTAATKSGQLRSELTVDLASAPNVVRGFDAMGRQEILGQASIEYLWKMTAVHIQLGARSTSKGDRQVFDPDGSYIAQRIGDTVVYAGYLTHWWGPGWISAMSVSNNARAIPQVGISRISTAPFESPWLSWIGPWQMEFFVGVLDGPRIARNTIYDGFRFAVSPIPHLEVGLSRTDQMCGTGHPCKPLVAYFTGINGSSGPNSVNDQGNIDIRYSYDFSRWAFEVYAQAMNEDNWPFAKSSSSHLFGGSIWVPYQGNIARLTIEYTDSLATANLFGGNIQHGTAYNNGQYPDGMRYRGRTLGFSLDSDSRLFTVQASLTDNLQRSLTLTYHRADVSSPWNTAGNAVTTGPATINLGQLRLSVPFEVNESRLRLEIEGRLQDDQPRPDKGFLASIEAAITVGL